MLKKLFNNINYSLSISSLAELKKNYKHKICYKKKYSFLNLKNSTSTSLANKFNSKGNLLKSYKLLKKFYYVFFLQKHFKKLPKDCNFLFFYKRFNSFKNLDRVLFWKFNLLDCMFTLKTKELKKKKKKKKKILFKLIYISGIKRILLAFNLVKLLILLRCKKKEKCMTMLFFLPLYKYLVNDKKNQVLAIKYKIYQKKLMQVQS